MNVTGAVKVIDIPDDFCITTARDFLVSLEKYLAVEFSVEQITNTVVSSEEPTQTERDLIWYKLDTSGNFVGIYIFVQGEWNQMFPAPFSVSKIVGGDSRTPPRGWTLVSSDLPGISDGMLLKLQEGWYRDVSNTYWVIFEVVYTGL